MRHQREGYDFYRYWCPQKDNNFTKTEKTRRNSKEQGNCKKYQFTLPTQKLQIHKENITYLYCYTSSKAI